LIWNVTRWPGDNFVGSGGSMRYSLATKLRVLRPIDSPASMEFTSFSAIQESFIGVCAAVIALHNTLDIAVSVDHRGERAHCHR
jgi:hypothetical protein